MAKYLSNRQKNLKVGIVSYTESNTVLEVTGKVGIGTTNATTDLDVNGNIRLRGILYDKDNQPGTAGQILVSTGSGIDWANGAPASAISGITIREEGTIVGGANSVTELNFVGNIVSAASTAGIATITFSDYIANSGVATYATSAGIATNLKGGLVGNIPYQSAADTTVFLANGSSGTILQSNGVGNAPSWVAAAPAGAITGLTVRDEGTIVGGTNSVSQLNFVGSNISVASTAGIATVTIADNLVGTALSISGISTVGFITATNIWNAGITTSSRITLNGANDGATGGGQIYLNGATGNRIDFNTNGVNPPAFSNRSNGTKLVLYPTIGASAVDYALGIDTNTLWYSIPTATSTAQHRWYAGTTQLADLKGSGELVIGSSSLTGTSSQRLQVIGGAYVSGNLGVGVTNPIAPLEVLQDTTGFNDISITNSNTGNNTTKSSRLRFRLTDTVGSRKDVAYIVGYPNDSNSALGGYLSFFTRTLDSTPTEKLRLDNNGNLVLGSSFTATGTASQPLQVTGGAYVSTRLGVGVTNPASNTQVAIAGTLGISEVGGAGTRTLFTSSGSGFVLNHNDNSNINIQSQGSNRLAYQFSNNAWAIPSGGTSLLVGTGATTGTTNQLLRVEGGAYISGSVGIGTTNPEKPLHLSSSVPTPLIIQRVSAANAAIEYRNPTSSMWAGLAGNALGWGVAAAENVGSNAQILVTRTGGELLVGSVSATGTASQLLQVTGGAYVSGSVGIGVTNPQDELHLGAASNIGIRLQDTAPGGGSYATINYNDNGSGINALTLGADEGNTGTNTEIRFNIDGSEVSRYAVGGQLLVGTSVTTGTANQKLQVTGGAYVSENIGIGTTNPTSKLTVQGDILVSGVVTATTFIGALTGTATTASSVAANSVGLGTHTYGDYVKDITGTANQITVTSGTGEGSSPTLSIPSQFTAPQDVTITRDLQVNRNLNVTGNITIGGTSATLFTTEFKVYDPDIVLGFRTDANNNDVSTDNTANHGGIAIASTEGTPLISLYDVGVGETNPATYKKFMWFKSGTFSGLGTDAWLSNYAIGIGSTQVPNGVRLAAGGMQVTDSTLSVPQLNISGVSTFSGITTHTEPLFGTQASFTGVVTASSFSGNASSATYADNAGIATFATNAGVSTSVIGGIGSITQLSVSGITTTGTLNVGTGGTIITTTTGGLVGINTTNPQSALDVRGTITIGEGAVGINSVFSTTDIQSWYYTNKSKNTGGDDATPQAVYVGAAGTAMFIVGDSGNEVNQYTLSTPYDVSTAGAVVATFSTATQETNPLGIDFNPTGTKMFISGNTGVAPLIASGEYVHEYSLSTAWTVSSAGYTTSYNVTQDTAPQGVTFGNSGSKMYVCGSVNDTIYQYSLSTPYSIASGVTYDNISLVLGTAPLLLETGPVDISFNSTGTVLWVIGQTNDRIYEFRLGTAWDISTAVFYDDVYVGFLETTPTGLHVIPEQNVAYIVGSGSDIVYQYSTNTPAIEIASSGISSVSSIVLNNETRVKDKLYVKGLAHFDTNIVTQGNIQVDGSTTITGNITVSGGSISAGNNATTLLGGNTTTNITMASGQTTGTLAIGAAAQTGTMTVGLSTASQTTNIQAGANASGTQKTINLGTGGLAGSRTLITVGSAVAGAASTVTIPSPTNLLIGTATTTGTASQPLQVSGGAYVSGNLGVGNTNGEGIKLFVSQGAPAANRPVALITDDGTIPTMTSGATLRISNDGSINSFALLEAESSAGKLVFTNAGNLGIGTTNPQDTLDVGVGTIRLYNKSVPSRFSQIYQDGALTFKNSAVGDDFQFLASSNSLMVLKGSGPLILPGTASLTGTASQLLQVTGGAYVSGSVGIGTTNPTSKLSVVGDGNFTGVVTATSFRGDGSQLTGISASGSVSISTNTTNSNLLIPYATSFGSTTGLGATSLLVYNPSSGNAGIGTTNPTSKLSVVGDANFTGVVTATTFVGALSGTATSTTNIPNLSGDVSSNNTVTTLATVNSNVGTYGDAGAIPSITVNAKGLVTGVTTVAPNNGQLSLAVSGTGLSGSATFTANQSGSSTFTVTSNATDANTPSTIVARDASGNFSAGTITANLAGTATTATNLADAANITTGTINSARLSGTYNINVSYASTAGVATVAQGLTGTPNITVGVVTATSFVKSGGTSGQFLKADGSVDSSTYLTTTGSGTNLSGIVTSIVAGTNITVSGSTGQVTINSTATGGGAALDILEVMLFA